MIRIGPGGGSMEAREDEAIPFSQLYTFDKREEGARSSYVVRSPFGGKLEADITGDEEKTLTFVKMLRPEQRGGVDTLLASFIMIKAMIIRAREELEKEGGRLAYIKLPMGNYDLQHLFALSGVGELFGADAISAGKRFFERRSSDEPSSETPGRRAGDKPKDIVLTIDEITERLKEYEERHGTIRQ